MANEFTADNLVRALTQLQGMEGGYEALAGGLGEAYPGATFDPMSASDYSAGFKARNWEPVGGATPVYHAGEPFQLNEDAVRARLASGGHWPASYEAMWPTLTGLVPKESWYRADRGGIGKMGGGDFQQQGNLQKEGDFGAGTVGTGVGAATTTPSKPTEAQLRGEGFPNTIEGYHAYVDYLSTLDLTEGERGERGLSFLDTVTSPTQTNVATGDAAGTAAGGRVNVEKAFTTVGGGSKIPPENADDPVNIPVVKADPDLTPLDQSGPIDSQTLLPALGAKTPQSPDLNETVVSDSTDYAGSDDIIESSADTAADYNPDESITSSRIGTGEYAGDKTGYPGADVPSPSYDRGEPAPFPAVEGVGDQTVGDKEVNDITKNMSDNQKAEVGNIANQARNYLKSIGWADSGEWGYARTRNMLTGGGQGQVVTQGPLVPWKSMGRDASSTRYISNVGDRDYLPSRLAPGERLGETTATSAIDYVPPSKRTGWEQSIDLTGVTGAGIQEGGEGAISFHEHLEGLSGVDIDSIPEGLNLNAAVVRSQDNVSQLKDLSEKDFEGVDSWDKVGNLVERKLGLQGVSDGVANFLQELTGMEEADLKGPGLWNTLNSSIPAFKTGEFGITPLDIILVAAGGLPALGPVIMRKFMESLLKPVTSAIEGGLSRVFGGIFKGGGVDVSQADMTAMEIEGLANSLGIQKHFGMVDKGTYYDASGNVHATNMQPLGMGSHDAGSSGVFRIAAHEMAAKHDPNYKGVYYNLNNGDVTVEGQDGTKTVVGTMPIASNGDVLKGDVVEKGGRKESKTAAHQVKIIYVDPSGKPLESRPNWYYKSSKKDTGAVGGGKQVVKTIWDWLAELAGGSTPP